VKKWTYNLKYTNILALFLFINLVFLMACSRQPEQPGVVTEVVEVEGEEQVITRVVRPPITVEPNPEIVSRETGSSVTLDYVFILNDPPGIDPQVNDSDESVTLIENLFAGLTRFNHTLNQVEPMLAESWEVSENGRQWTFNLRDDIYWVKPTEQRIGDFVQVEPVAPVVADDVVYAIQRACSKETNTPDAVTLFIIDGCEQLFSLAEPTTTDFNRMGIKAIDDVTIQFTLTKPASQFLTITSLWIMRPVPRFLVEEFQEEWTAPDNLLTSGPFIPLNERYNLQRNPIWPLSRPENKNVDFVNFIYQSNLTNAYQFWEAKEADITPLPEFADETLMQSLTEKSDLVPDLTLFYLAYNFESGVFREPAVRRAFSAAIDRETLIEELFGNEAIGMRHLVPPSVVGAMPVDEVGMGYDPDYARLQLQSSGFGSCRLMPPIRLLVTTSDQSLRQAEILREMWIDELGCTEEQIEIDQAPFGTLLANTRRDAGINRPDMWELGWAPYYPDAQNWFGDLLHCVDSENRQDRECTEVDDLIRRASFETNLNERLALYRQIESMFFSREGIIPLIPLYVEGEFLLSQNWVTYVPAQFGGEQFDTYTVDAVLKQLERSR
jgi:oligopeptide transport system substrate-binding protein